MRLTKISITPTSVKHQAVGMVMTKADVNAVEVIQLDLNFRQKVTLEHAVKMSHIINSSKIAAMDLCKLLELVKSICN